MNREGQQKEVNLDPEGESITSLVAAYPNYLYIVRDPKWTLEVYDLSRNILMWKTALGRGGGDAAFYDASSNIVYVTGPSIQAFDNTTGALLWDKAVDSFTSVFEAGVLYDYESVNENDHYRLAAINVENQQELWSQDFTFSPGRRVNNLKIVGDMLVLCGGDLIALDKSDGQQKWKANVGDNFYQCPVEFNSILYEKTGASRTVYAISPDDGAVIGHVTLETPGILDGADAKGGVYALQDGIVFNTKKSVVIYRYR
jgi:outer membrane protein assembly factor BamB